MLVTCLPTTAAAHRLPAYRGKPHVGGQGVYTRHLTKALVDLGHHVEVLGGQPYPGSTSGSRSSSSPASTSTTTTSRCGCRGSGSCKHWTDWRRGRAVLARHVPRAAGVLACGPGSTCATAGTTSTSSTTTSASATACSPSSGTGCRSSPRSTTPSPSTAASRWSTPRPAGERFDQAPLVRVHQHADPGGAAPASASSPCRRTRSRTSTTDHQVSTPTGCTSCRSASTPTLFRPLPDVAARARPAHHHRLAPTWP